MFFLCSSNMSRQPGLSGTKHLIKCTAFCILAIVSTLEFILRATTPLYLVYSNSNTTGGFCYRQGNTLLLIKYNVIKKTK